MGAIRKTSVDIARTLEPFTAITAPPHDRDSPARGGGSETQLALGQPGE